MKKAFIYTISAFIMLAGIQSAFAHTHRVHSGGFSGPSASNMTVTSVKEVLNMRDNSFVTLKGNIILKIDHEKYVFKDNTGKITVEIDDDDWMGTQAGPNDTVIIEGDIDRDWNSVIIEVEKVTKCTNP